MNEDNFNNYFGGEDVGNDADTNANDVSDGDEDVQADDVEDDDSSTNDGYSEKSQLTAFLLSFFLGLLITRECNVYDSECCEYF